jgi:predicted secreted acid phosphatase
MVRSGMKKCDGRTTFGALFLSLVMATAAIGCPCQSVNEPADAGKNINPAEGLTFSYTPEFQKEFDSAVESARSAVQARLGESKLAIVSDIDETLLDNREMFKEHPDFKWPEFMTWANQAKAPVLKPTADFLAWARKNGVAIFLITGRPESMRAATIENLVKQGVAYDGLYMRNSAKSVSAEQVKTPYREEIEKLGFKIVVNIGDQYSDIRGGHAEDCEKLPNRIYFVR